MFASFIPFKSAKRFHKGFFLMGLNNLQGFFPPTNLLYNENMFSLCHTHPEHKFLLNLWSGTSFLKIHTSHEEKLTATLWLLARSHRHEWKGLCYWRIIYYSTFLAWLLNVCSFTRAVLIYINTCLPNFEVQWLIWTRWTSGGATM